MAEAPRCSKIPFIKDYHIGAIGLTACPEIDCVVAVPLKMIFINIAASPGANVIRLVNATDDPMGQLLQFHSRE